MNGTPSRAPKRLIAAGLGALAAGSLAAAAAAGQPWLHLAGYGWILAALALLGWMSRAKQNKLLRDAVVIRQQTQELSGQLKTQLSEHRVLHLEIQHLDQRVIELNGRLEAQLRQLDKTLGTRLSEARDRVDALDRGLTRRLEEISTRQEGLTARVDSIREHSEGLPGRLKEIVARFEARERTDQVAASNFEHIQNHRLKDIVPVREPLVLISQVQRSGGTLLAQLFDGHSQCHAHPPELHIGNPDKYTWPALDLGAGPDRWFAVLSSKHDAVKFREGYSKHIPKSDNADWDVYPLLVPPALHERIFRSLLETKARPTEREILDAYFTGYFNAWLDNRNLRSGPKTVVTAFIARMSSYPVSLERFFGVYPDGVLLSLVRDPKAWYASARVHDGSAYGDVETAMNLWIQSVSSAIEARSRFGPRVRLLEFERLLSATEPTMRELARFLGLEFQDSLLTPTFNGRPIRADSSFKVEKYGVLQDPLDRYKTILTAQEIAEIDRCARPWLEKAQAVIRSQAAASRDTTHSEGSEASAGRQAT